MSDFNIFEPGTVNAMGGGLWAAGAGLDYVIGMVNWILTPPPRSADDCK
jgi:hypothetical protein